MPTIEQIRAARALIGWSQGELAEHADLSQTGIARIENGTNQPNSTTLEKITAAFDKVDVEFIDDSGVRKRTREIKVLRGTQGFRYFMDDVYATAQKGRGEFCIFNGRPEAFYKWLGKDWYEFHAKRMRTIDKTLDFRIIIKEGDELFIAGSFAEYRWFPENMFNEQTIYVYGDKLAFLTFHKDDVNIRVMDQSEFADSFRVLFNIAWDKVSTKPCPL